VCVLAQNRDRQGADRPEKVLLPQPLSLNGRVRDHVHLLSRSQHGGQPLAGPSVDAATACGLLARSGTRPNGRRPTRRRPASYRGSVPLQNWPHCGGCGHRARSCDERLQELRQLCVKSSRSCLRWARHGSTRYLWSSDKGDAAVRYVLEKQGEPMACSPRLSAPLRSRFGGARNHLSRGRWRGLPEAPVAAE
jgi:hypothetical protein